MFRNSLPNLNIEWSFQNTNTQSCTRNPDGTITCVSDHPNGFEWCVNAAVVDANGVVYANSEDGNLYAIGQGGSLIQNIFQQLAIGAAYTPASMDGSGRIYSQNDGHLFVVAKIVHLDSRGPLQLPAFILKLRPASAGLFSWIRKRNRAVISECFLF